MKARSGHYEFRGGPLDGQTTDALHLDLRYAQVPPRSVIEVMSREELNKFLSSEPTIHKYEARSDGDGFIAYYYVGT